MALRGHIQGMQSRVRLCNTPVKKLYLEDTNGIGKIHQINVRYSTLCNTVNTPSPPNSPSDQDYPTKHNRSLYIYENTERNVENYTI